MPAGQTHRNVRVYISMQHKQVYIVKVLPPVVDQDQRDISPVPHCRRHSNYKLTITSWAETAELPAPHLRPPVLLASAARELLDRIDLARRASTFKHTTEPRLRRFVSSLKQQQQNQHHRGVDTQQVSSTCAPGKRRHCERDAP